VNQGQQRSHGAATDAEAESRSRSNTDAESSTDADANSEAEADADAESQRTEEWLAIIRNIYSTGGQSAIESIWYY
jgi:hypothetical protein